MLIINRLAKVTNNSIVQRAGSISVIGIGSNEDRGNRVPGIDEVPVKFYPGHRRHIDVSDQHGGFLKTMRGEEIGRRCKSLDAVALRSQEPFYRLAKELIILNDRHQRCFGHKTPGISLEPHHTSASPISLRSHVNSATCAKVLPGNAGSQ
jgi:hypothetical protein